MTDGQTLGDKLRDFAEFIFDEGNSRSSTLFVRAIILADEADELEYKVLNLRERLKYAIKKNQRALND